MPVHTTSLPRRSFLMSAAALSATSTFPNLLFAQEAGRSDADWVFATLSALHPGLLRYQSEAEFAQRHKAFAASFNDGDFDAKVLALQSLLAAIKCGHTYINPSNQSAEVRQKLYGSRRLLPFNFRWIGNDMVVVSDPHSCGLSAGTRITRINGTQSADILAALLPLARADGGNDDKRRALMSVSGAERAAMFDLYYDLVFKPSEQVTIESVSPDGQASTRSIATIDYATRQATGRKQIKDDPLEPIWFAEKTNGGKTRIITMPTWGTYKTKWDWEGWLRSELGSTLGDGTTGIIFDLRGNEGGYNIGEDMLPFFLPRPLNVARTAERVRFREVSGDLRSALNTWDESFYTLGSSGTRFNDRFIELAPARTETIEPMPQTFKGKVAVLIGADNSSATFTFAQQLREAGVARLIGEPTGGNRRGINGGAYFFTVLPESGIEFDIPLIGYFPEGKEPDAGLVPDDIVPRTAESLAAGSDPALEAALKAVA